MEIPIRSRLGTRWILALACVWMPCARAASELVVWDDFARWGRSAHGVDGGFSYFSPRVTHSRPWKELIVSWNMEGTSFVRIEVEAYRREKFVGRYCLGQWTLAPEGKNPRTSGDAQRTTHGHVATDTLVIEEGADVFQVHAITHDPQSKLKLLTVNVSDDASALVPLPRLPTVSLPVPRKSQADFPEGIDKWCSPTTTAMLLDYWATQKNRPDWRHTVPETAAAVFDPGWPGTGNWPFNMAFVGSHSGLRGCVARANRPQDLVSWIEAGYPVGVSVSLALLNGEAKPTPGDGHLIVVCGGTRDGKVEIADPGRALPRIHREIDPEVFMRAWAHSAYTVYLVWPEDQTPPVWAGTHLGRQHLQNPDLHRDHEPVRQTGGHPM